VYSDQQLNYLFGPQVGAVTPGNNLQLPPKEDFISSHAPLVNLALPNSFDGIFSRINFHENLAKEPLPLKQPTFKVLCNKEENHAFEEPSRLLPTMDPKNNGSHLSEVPSHLVS